MASSFVASRAQLIYAFCLPLAVLLGYLLADPMDTGSIAVVLLVVSVLAVPILMSWYHPLLVFTWHAAITPYILPGQPYIWMLLAVIGFGFAVVNRFTSPEARFVSLPSVNRSLVCLLGVVLATAWVRGGFGFRIFGAGHYGGKNYFSLAAAIVGYFALISQRIPKNRAGIYIALFFLSGLTSFIPNLAYLGGSPFEFLYYVFPSSYAQEQAMADYSVNVEFGRVYGLTFGSNALYCWLLARYGLRGCFDTRKPLRMLLFLAAALGCLFCGFRSFMVLFVLTVASQFVFEGLWRTRVMVGTLAGALVAAAVVIPNVDRLPPVVQRSLSFLPLGINPSIRASAQGSSDWRIRMWSDLLPELSKYALEGKGCGFDPNELSFAEENGRRGYSPEYSWAIVTGSYHSGPLTVAIPFGIWGVLAFGWFVVASLRYLYRTVQRGDPELRNINRFILAYFVARLVYFLAVFGMFPTDLFFFTGLMGMSVSLNGAEQPQTAEPEPEEQVEQQQPDEELVTARTRRLQV